VRALDEDRVAADVGRRIAELRRERELTQEQLSVKMGATVQWIAQLEGGVNFTIGTLVKLANALKVPLVELFEPPKPSDGVRRRGRPRKST